MLSHVKQIGHANSCLTTNRFVFFYTSLSLYMHIYIFYTSHSLYMHTYIFFFFFSLYIFNIREMNIPESIIQISTTGLI